MATFSFKSLLCLEQAHKFLEEGGTVWISGVELLALRGEFVRLLEVTIVSESEQGAIVGRLEKMRASVGGCFEEATGVSEWGSFSRAVDITVASDFQYGEVIERYCVAKIIHSDRFRFYF